MINLDIFDTQRLKEEAIVEREVQIFKKSTIMSWFKKNDLERFATKETLSIYKKHIEDMNNYYEALFITTTIDEQLIKLYKERYNLQIKRVNGKLKNL